MSYYIVLSSQIGLDSIVLELFEWLCNSGNPTQVAMMMKSDARADVLAENAQLADDFIKTLFAIVYEVYGSSVHLSYNFISFAHGFYVL